MKRVVFPTLLLITTQCGPDHHQAKLENPPPQEEPATPAPNAPQADATIGLATDANKMHPLTINFQPKVGNENLVCFDKSDELLAKGQIFTDIRMFVSNLTFIDEKGQEVLLNLDIAENSSNLQYVDTAKNSIALLNFLEPGCASSDATDKVKINITGQLPQGVYKKVRFQIGLPYVARAPELTSVPSALAPSDMGWMWQHSPADFQVEVNTGASHGSVKKILNKLISKDKRLVTLAIDHTQKTAENAVNVNLDFSKLFKSTAAEFAAGLEDACDNSTMPITESAPYCAHAFKALGLEVKDAQQPYEQTLFSVMP